jgi:DNA-binding transcriptional LysR family regulator
MALKLNTQASLWSNEMAGGQVANFSAYEGKIDAAILKEVQGVCRSPPLLPREPPPQTAPLPPLPLVCRKHHLPARAHLRYPRP